MYDEYEEENGEQTVYDEDTREDMIDNDELSPEEEAFMKGYDETDKHNKKDKESSDEHIEE